MLGLNPLSLMPKARSRAEAKRDPVHRRPQTTCPLFSKARKIGKNRSGAAAVEFAIILVPFMLLLMGTLEVAAIFVASTTLENAVYDGARIIRTDQAGARTQAANVKNRICSSFHGLLDCSRLYVDVRVFSDFNSARGVNLVNNSEIDPTRTGFEASGTSQIVLVTAYYEWQVITPIVGGFMSNLSNNRLLLSAASAFRNEP